MASFENIFPSTVMLDSLERQFTEKEQAFFDECLKKLVNNAGNKTSENNYVLNSEPLNDLKTALTLKVNQYFQIIVNPKSECELYITQSWINYTNAGGYHHKHYHPNSYLSGIIYLDADKLQDKVYFKKPLQDFFSLEPKNYNLSNSDTWFFTTGTQDIVIFPSSLEHYVETVSSDRARISLSFNTFLKGNIGVNNQLTELIL